MFWTDLGASKLKQLLMISIAIPKLPLTVFLSAPVAAEGPLGAATASAAYLAPLISSPF